MSERGSLAGALQRLAGELLGATTPAAVGTLVVTTAAELLGADAAAVFARVDGQTLESLHTTGWPDEVTRPFHRLDLHRGRPLSDAVLDRRPVWLEDAAQWRSRYPDMAAVGTASDMQASACLPLSVEDRDLGAVVFSFTGPRRFSVAEREFLMAITALCAQGFDRARLLVAEREARETAERQLGRMTFLSRTTRLMEAPLSVEQRLQQLADLVVSEIADWCAVHLVRGNRVDQVAVAHSDPAKVAFVARLQERYPPDPDAPGGAIRVSRTGEPAYYPEVPDELLVAAAVDEEHLALIRSIGMRSALIVPLAVRGRRLGALTLVQTESDRGFDQADLAFALQLAATASVALDNARLYEQQWHTAHTLQAALLPSDLPTVPGLRLAARYRAATADRADIHVGGDLYDVVPGPDGVRGRRRRRLRQGRGGGRAHRPHPAHRARGDRPRARARRGPGAAQPGDAPRQRRTARSVRDRRARPALPHRDGRRRAAGQRGPSRRRWCCATGGPRPCPRRGRCWASIRTSP